MAGIPDEESMGTTEKIANTLAKMRKYNCKLGISSFSIIRFF